MRVSTEKQKGSLPQLAATYYLRMALEYGESEARRRMVGLVPNFVDYLMPRLTEEMREEYMRECARRQGRG